MDAAGITSALALVTGVVASVFGLVTTFPVNVICVVMVAGLAIRLVKKVKSAVKH